MIQGTHSSQSDSAQAVELLWRMSSFYLAFVSPPTKKRLKMASSMRLQKMSWACGEADSKHETNLLLLGLLLYACSWGLIQKVTLNALTWLWECVDSERQCTPLPIISKHTRCHALLVQLKCLQCALVLLFWATLNTQTTHLNNARRVRTVWVKQCPEIISELTTIHVDSSQQVLLGFETFVSNSGIFFLFLFSLKRLTFTWILRQIVDQSRI